MLNRILKLEEIREDSLFLWGSSQPGKSTLLKALFPDAKLIIVSLDDTPRKQNNVEVWPAHQFLEQLWKDKIIC